MPNDAMKVSALKATDVPAAIVLTCPMHQAVIKPCDTCSACPHFTGLGVLNDHPSLQWHERYMVLCNYRRKIPLKPLGAPAPGVIGKMAIA